MKKQEVMQLLRERGISYSMTEHGPVYTIEEILENQIPNPETIAKNLFVRDDKKKNYYLVSVREEKRVNLKEFQERFGTRRLSFASEGDLGPAFLFFGNFRRIRRNKNKQDPFGPCLKKGRKNMKKSNQSIASTLF